MEIPTTPGWPFPAVPLRAAVEAMRRRMRRGRPSRHPRGVFDLIDALTIAMLARCPAACSGRAIATADLLETLWMGDPARLAAPSSGHRLEGAEVVEAMVEDAAAFEVLQAMGLVERLGGSYRLTPLADSPRDGGEK